MVKDAESHAEEDRKRKERAEARNQLDSLIYTTEKSLKDYGGDVDATTKANIEAALEKAKQSLESEEVDVLKGAADELSQASHKLAEAMYARAAKEQEQGTGAQGEQAKAEETENGQAKENKENVVDADFEEVK
jgi:molecular chaperone DnaK